MDIWHTFNILAYQDYIRKKCFHSTLVDIAPCPPPKYATDFNHCKVNVHVFYNDIIALNRTKGVVGRLPVLTNTPENTV